MVALTPLEPGDRDQYVGPLRAIVNARLEENSIQSVNALPRDLSEYIQLLILL